MADSEVFERTCELLRELTHLSELEVRGTVRLVLRSAGLSTRTVGRSEMLAVLQRDLEPELAQRSVARAGEVCRRLEAELQAFEPSAVSPYDVFSRLG